MLSCCTTVPSCNRQGGFHLAASLPSSLAMGRDGPTGSAPIATFGVRCVRQRSSGSEGPPRQLVESVVELHLWRPGKSFGGSIPDQQKNAQSKSWLPYSHTSCPSMVFLWLSLEFDWLQIDLSMAENFPKTMPEKLCKLEPQGKKSHRFVEHKQRSHFSSVKSTWEN